MESFSRLAFRSGSAFLFVLASLLTSAIRPAAAENVRVDVIQDNSIVMVGGEWTVNGGRQGRIRIKGNQHIVAMGFDLSAVRGREVRSASLVCAQGDHMIEGVTISTIATPWDEYQSNGLTAGVEGIVDWGYPGARFPAVCGGNSFTLVTSIDSTIVDGSYRWALPADMVYAMVIGAAQGLAIHEHTADYGRNPTIFSREQSSKKPYLLLDVGEPLEQEPTPPSDLQVLPLGPANAELSLVPPRAGFAYEVTVDGHRLGRHNIPFVNHDSSLQTIFLRDLPDSILPDAVHEIQVASIDRMGRSSGPVEFRGIVFRSTPVETPDVSVQRYPAAETRGISVVPVLDKYDQSGDPVGDLPADYRRANPIFDGTAVHLRAAAGEVVGFQVLLRGQGDAGVQVALRSLPVRIDLWQSVYVLAGNRAIPDALMPLPDQITLNEQQDQSIIADIFVPFDAKAGEYFGELTVSDGRTVPLLLEVLPFSLPRRATFFCEMNSYGLPDHVDDYYALQQIAYDHRVHANILHYSHNTAAPGSRKSNLDMRLRSGRRMDNRRYDDIAPGAAEAYWEDFAEAFGPFIDGSLFNEGHRGPIPAPGFYLTFHESWPLHCRAYFNGNPDAYEAFKQSPEYAQTYVNILEDFVRLAKRKQWHDAGFQVYFNNKGGLDQLTKAPWILDEPSSYWDYRALQYYGDLTDRGRAEADEIQIDYRIDISRPEYCRGQLERQDDLWIVSSSAFQNYRRLVTDRMRTEGLQAWVYGTSNHVDQSNRNIQAWALDAWQDGATGIVPWQTVDKSGKALNEADQLGLFIFDRTPDGKTVIRHSLRLKAYREAEQLIEYLSLVEQRRGWSRAQMHDFIAAYVDLDGEVQQTSEEDAGTAGYGRLSVAGLESIRAAAISLLTDAE
ncbi:hypothetical protein [Rubinisphaera margarita]|uniref:hypothetical protein n=1 Tax=Rubinisphaera margarita TaxID=2909586 RepID=UPI001EE84C1C|nr:hypothetical protein [Rubinisphaera margarita]MCG6156557.1 hypothetical protein [Rubinisphaera margarita]